MRMLRLGSLLLCASGLVLSGCDEKLSSIAGPTPTLEPTFRSIQRDIFQTADAAGRAACVTCHTNVGRNPSGGLNLVADIAYSQLVDVASARKAGVYRVIRGDPENSYLIHKLRGRSDIVGVRMPQNGPYLTDGQIRIIERWIEIGAPNN